MTNPITPWLRDTRASVATMFAFSLLPMLIVAGAAVDYSGVLALRSSLQNASDSASLALCQQPVSVQASQLQTLAQSWVNAVNPKNAVAVDPLVVTNNPRQITMTARATYPSSFGRIVGLSTIPVATQSQCTAPAPKIFEIALVLDNTGSMAKSSGSQSKIQAVQQAATNFVTYVFTNAAFDPTSRISIVPFAAAVAVDPTTYRNATWIDQLGASPYHWNNIANAAQSGFINRLQVFNSLKASNSSWGWAGCLESPSYPSNVSDGAPQLTKPDTFYVPYLSPDEASNKTSSGQYSNYPFYSPNVNGNTYFGNSDLVFNNYLNNSTTQSNCSSTPTTEQAAAMRACKYVKPVAAPTNTNLGTPFGPNFSCNGLPLIQLTAKSNQQLLFNKINAMSPGGNTDIHEGLMWGWRTLSPNSVFADGSAYNARNTQKVIVLMTDGANTWSSQYPDASNTYWTSFYKSWYSAYGYFRNADGSTPNGRLPPGNANPSNNAQARAAIDQLTLEACTNAKAAGVLIYTVGFSVPSDPIDQEGLTLLQNCANNASQAFVAERFEQSDRGVQQHPERVGGAASVAMSLLRLGTGRGAVAEATAVRAEPILTRRRRSETAGTNFEANLCPGRLTSVLSRRRRRRQGYAGTQCTGNRASAKNESRRASSPFFSGYVVVPFPNNA